MELRGAASSIKQTADKSDFALCVNRAICHNEDFQKPLAQKNGKMGGKVGGPMGGTRYGYKGTADSKPEQTDRLKGKDIFSALRHCEF